VTVVAIPQELLLDAVDALDRLDCQFFACNGPTLEPEDMVTCFRCSTLAQLRAAAGQPPRRSDELSATERIRTRDEEYMRPATGRAS
jgi:hypothetical protein